MKKTTTTLLKTTVILGLAALAPQLSSAQAPTGSLSYTVTNSANVLYDFSLVQELNGIQMDILNKRGDEVKVAYTNLLIQDGRGKLLGLSSNTVVLTVPDNPETTLQGLCASKGSITSAKGVAHLTFATKVVGVANLRDSKGNAADHKVSAQATYTVKMDTTTGQMTGHASEKAVAVGLGSIADSGDISQTNLPAELGDGSWTLVLNFTGTNATKLSGDAKVTLQTGQVYPFALKGIFSPKNQQSKLNLKGVNAGLGSSLLVTLQSNQVTRVVGRVSGQSVNIK